MFEYDYKQLVEKLWKSTNGYWTMLDELYFAIESSEKEEIIKILLDLEVIEIKRDWQASFVNAYKDGNLTIPRTEELKVFRVLKIS